MKTQFFLASFALVSCTDDSSRDLRTDDATAATAQGSDAAGSRTFLPSSMDASAGASNGKIPSSSKWRPAYCDAPTADLLPESPTKFRVELAQTECFGFCPIYSLTVDQDGRVTYYGESWVARFGPQEKQVSAQDARAIYDALYQAGYNKLNRCYLEQVDGCRVTTDAPYSYWDVSADGMAKALDRYLGCEHPSPELHQVDVATRVVLEKAGVNAWVTPSPTQKPLPLQGPLMTTTYRLSHAGQSLGTLTIRAAPEPAPGSDASVSLGSYRWQIVDCANVPQASGSVSVNFSFYVLLSGQASFQLTPPKLVKPRPPIALPSLGDVGSILIDIPMTGDLQTAHAQRGDEDIPLELSAAQPGC
jgi:hypothetical protein